MLQSKYLTQDGLTAWFRECYRRDFKYVFYNTNKRKYMLSEQEPVFRDTTYMYCNGETYVLNSYFAELVVKDLLKDRNYIAFEDHIDTVDWSQVPVDTPILVTDEDKEYWARRYFAGYKDGHVYAWDDGRTSWTSYGSNETTEWKHAKLAEDTNT